MKRPSHTFDVWKPWETIEHLGQAKLVSMLNKFGPQFYQTNSMKKTIPRCSVPQEYCGIGTMQRNLRVYYHHIRRRIVMIVMYCTGHSVYLGGPFDRMSGIPQRDPARFSRFSTTKQTGLGSDLSWSRSFLNANRNICHQLGFDSTMRPYLTNQVVTLCK